MDSNSKFSHASLLIIGIISFLVVSCGSGNQNDPPQSQNDNQGAVAFSIVLEGPVGIDTGRDTQSFKSCHDIQWVTAAIFDTNGLELQSGAWPCTDHSGILDGVPAGDNRKIVVRGVQGAGPNGTIIYQGEADGITVQSNITTEVGQISAHLLNPDLSHEVDQDGDGFTPDGGDCDDNDETRNPGATDVCLDEIDQDCNPETCRTRVWFSDVDNDGHGDTASSIHREVRPANTVANADDCNDLAESIHPGAADLCGDGVDQDCDPNSCSIQLPSFVNMTQEDAEDVISGIEMTLGTIDADCSASIKIGFITRQEPATGTNVNYNRAVNLVVSSGLCNVAFANSALESIIRNNLWLPTGPLSEALLRTLNTLNASVRAITSLEGIQYCANLQYLDLSYNNLTDNPGNEVSVLEPLRKLINLQHLYLNNNRFTDSPEDQYSVIEPLSGLTNLQTLCLNTNNIQRIELLAGLTNLRKLNLSNTKVVNISPLVNNPGINQGDMVYLDRNSLDSISCTSYIPQLESRGVTVYHDCP